LSNMESIVEKHVTNIPLRCSLVPPSQATWMAMHLPSRATPSLCSPPLPLPCCHRRGLPSTRASLSEGDGRAVSVGGVFSKAVERCIASQPTMVAAMAQGPYPALPWPDPVVPLQDLRRTSVVLRRAKAAPEVNSHDWRWAWGSSSVSSHVGRVIPAAGRASAAAAW
jgi:hypothetical protein